MTLMTYVWIGDFMLLSNMKSLFHTYVMTLMTYVGNRAFRSFQRGVGALCWTTSNDPAVSKQADSVRLDQRSAKCTEGELAQKVEAMKKENLIVTSSESERVGFLVGSKRTRSSCDFLFTSYY